MDLEAWAKRRDRTINTYLLFGTVFGIEYMLSGVTILPYLQQIVSPKRATYFFSLAAIVYPFFSAVAGIILGRLVDRTRKVILVIDASC